MKLTRRDFLSGAAVTIATLVAGLKAKAAGGYAVPDNVARSLMDPAFKGASRHCVMKWPSLVPYRNVSPELVQVTEDQEAWRRDLPTGPLRLGDLEAILWSLEPPYTETQRAWIKGRFPLTQFDEEGYAR